MMPFQEPQDLTSSCYDLEPEKPNFFIVGAPKCGTTSLYEYLKCHPQIFLPDVKEPNFFGSDRRLVAARQRTLSEYLALFEGSERYRLRGEASTLYLQSETAAQEIFAFNSAAKIIVMIRDPVEMMHALHWQTLLTADEEIEDFREALAAEEDRARGDRVPPLTSDVDRLLYRRCARFSSQIQRYREVFGVDRVHVIVFDDLRVNVSSVYADVLSFLGADPYKLSDYPRVNEAARVRSRAVSRLVRRVLTARWLVDVARKMIPKPVGRKMAQSILSAERRVNRVAHERKPLPAELEVALRREFAPEVERIGRMLNRDLSGWTEPAHARRNRTSGATTGEV